MKIFSEIYMDELYVLISKTDIEVEIDDSDCNPKHPWFSPNGDSRYLAYANVNGHFIYGDGISPAEATHDFGHMLIFMDEIIREDAEHTDYCNETYQASIEWWLNNFHYMKLEVPAGFEDMAEQNWERWEEWSRKYDKDHIPFMLDTNYEDIFREDWRGREIIK
jgi:hypothetical protein